MSPSWKRTCPSASRTTTEPWWTPSTTPPRIRWATGAWRGSRIRGAPATELVNITASCRERRGSRACSGGGFGPCGPVGEPAAGARYGAHDVGQGCLDTVQVVGHGLHGVGLGAVGQCLDDRPVLAVGLLAAPAQFVEEGRLTRQRVADLL